MSVPWRMIVVDDDPKVRLLMERAFKAPEFEIHTFATGKAALERVAEIRPDCVVSDLLMPDMDGERFLRAMRTIPGMEPVPFVFVSAVRSEARIRAALDAGASAFLVKPFPLRDLVSKVRLLVEQAPATEKTPSPLALAHAGPGTPPLQQPLPLADDALPATVPLSPVAIAQARAAVHAPTQPQTGQSAAPLPSPDQSSPGLRKMDLQSSATGAGFGRYTRVDLRGRSLVVLTEASARTRSSWSPRS